MSRQLCKSYLTTTFLVITWFLSGGTGATQANLIFQVTLDTTALQGHPGGPFAVNFQLNDGSGTGNGTNTALLTGFQFGGGSANGPAATLGGASGDFTSGVTLIDSSFFNDFVQEFLPGTSLSFQVDLTTNSEPGPTPDAFSFAILDGNGLEIPTTSPVGGFVVVDILGANTVVQRYASDATIPVGSGDPVRIEAPVISQVPTTTVPEPATLGVWLLGVATVLLIRRIR